MKRILSYVAVLLVCVGFGFGATACGGPAAPTPVTPPPAVTPTTTPPQTSGVLVGVLPPSTLDPYDPHNAYTGDGAVITGASQLPGGTLEVMVNLFTPGTYKFVAGLYKTPALGVQLSFTEQMPVEFEGSGTATVTLRYPPPDKLVYMVVVSSRNSVPVGVSGAVFHNQLK